MAVSYAILIAKTRHYAIGIPASRDTPGLAVGDIDIFLRHFGMVPLLFHIIHHCLNTIAYLF
jgi:hypothetical protein